MYYVRSNVYKNTGRVVFSCTIIVVACVEASTHFAAEIDEAEGMKPLHLSSPKIILEFSIGTFSNLDVSIEK